MNKRTDYTKVGGFPMVQESLEWMQSSYRSAFGAMANYAGDKTILYGCVVAGSNVSNGWVSINGELMPFIGGSYSAGDEVIVVETSTSKLFEDNTLKAIYFEKVARIGSPGGFPFTDLKPPNIGVPTGTVLMWSGDVAAIPRGFALCDGTNGTPNLSGRFIVGYNAADVDYDTIGNIGGSKKHTLTIAEMPEHNHSMVYAGDAAAGPQGNHMRDVPTGFPKSTGNAGGGQAHENRPPYFTLAYIIKL